MVSKRWRHLRWWIYRRIVRMKGTTHSIALGIAIGVFVGIFLPPGMHLIAAIPLAWLLRANIIGATAGTLVANPVTMFPLYLFTCRTGQAIFSFFGIDLSLGHHLKKLLVDFIHLSWSDAGQQFGPFALCWVVGGALVGVAAALVAYYATFRIVKEIRKLTEEAHLRRLERHRALAAEHAAHKSESHDSADITSPASRA